MSNLKLRVLDCAKLYGSDREQKEFAHDFLAGITEVGFLKLVNHGLTEDDINMLLQQVSRAT
jgi:isopenicillin N synthase-like dioxygenase